ncbi:hypothetical protein JW823_05705 [bacterium]|nr:hypothetical protein [candidate division CSSED10-310 bacterium]
MFKSICKIFIFSLVAVELMAAEPAEMTDPPMTSGNIPGASRSESKGDTESIHQAPPLTRDTLLILPFTFDRSPGADLIAPRAAWILDKKLRAGKFQIEQMPDSSGTDATPGWSTREGLLDYAREKKIGYIISGHVEKVGIDRLSEWKGHRFLGMAEIPVSLELTVQLHSGTDNEIILEKTTHVITYVPRLRVFGMNRNPYPGTPRSIDAFVHDAIYRLSTDLISVIGNRHSKEQR